MRFLFPPRLLILSAIAVAVYPEVAKKCKPAAKVVADGVTKFAEWLQEAAKDTETPTAPPKADSTATAPPKAAAKTESAPAGKPAAKKSASKPKPKVTGAKPSAKTAKKPKATS